MLVLKDLFPVLVLVLVLGLEPEVFLTSLQYISYCGGNNNAGKVSLFDIMLINFFTFCSVACFPQKLASEAN